MNKVILITVLICITAMSSNFVSCKDNNSEPVVSATQLTEPETSAVSESVEDSGTKYCTLDELKQYSGENGNPMYVAVDGIVYDATEIRQWFGGQHEGCQAGSDLTNLIKESPHCGNFKKCKNGWKTSIINKPGTSFNKIFIKRQFEVKMQ